MAASHHTISILKSLGPTCHRTPAMIIRDPQMFLLCLSGIARQCKNKNNAVIYQNEPRNPESKLFFYMRHAAPMKTF